jgi:hypothetical protein
VNIEESDTRSPDFPLKLPPQFLKAIGPDAASVVFDVDTQFFAEDGACNSNDATSVHRSESMRDAILHKRLQYESEAIELGQILRYVALDPKFARKPNGQYIEEEFRVC